MIVVLDYGMGNLRSVERALVALGGEARVQGDLAGAEKLVLPGVGAFRTAMERLAPLVPDIKAFVAGGGPLLGICLGQQLLFESSEEHGATTGLGLLPGHVRYLQSPGLKVPHTGWTPVTVRETPLGEGIQSGDQFYFVHSLAAQCPDPSCVAMEATYGVTFTAAVCAANVWGTQFHPEKSSERGMRVLENFVRW